jgi:hypothetical protein
MKDPCTITQQKRNGSPVPIAQTGSYARTILVISSGVILCKSCVRMYTCVMGQHLYIHLCKYINKHKHVMNINK